MAASAKPETSYRSISGMAILALLLGIASPLALITPLLLAVPLATVFLALLALSRIAREPEVLSGRGLAYAALFLAVFFLVFTPARIYLRSQTLAEPAQQMGDAFLSLIQQNKLHAAHQLMEPRFLLRDPSRPLTEDYAEDEDASKELESFVGSETMTKLQSLDRRFEYRLESFDAGRDGEGHDALTLRYLVQPDAASGKRPFPLWMLVTRSVDDRTDAATWKLVDVRLTDPSAGRE